MTTILILSVIGIVAIIAELVLPGGILGVIGGLCLVGAVIATFVTYGSAAGTVAFAVLVGIGFVTLWVWMRLFHRLPFTKELVLNDTVGVDEGVRERESLVGRTGTALTDLMPSGRAEIEGNKVDVLAESTSIPKGANLVVTGTHGPSVTVREVKPGA